MSLRLLLGLLRIGATLFLCKPVRDLRTSDKAARQDLNNTMTSARKSAAVPRTPLMLSSESQPLKSMLFRACKMVTKLWKFGHGPAKETAVESRDEAPQTEEPSGAGFPQMRFA